MKIAYLVSLYPAASHTFIRHEIDSMLRLGLDLAVFSVRRPKQVELVDERAREESRTVRSLVPLVPWDAAAALWWVLFTRPIKAAQLLASVLAKSASLRSRLKWLAYFGEGVILARLIRRSGADHLHCHFGNAGSNPAMVAARLADVPLSITFHGIDLDEPERFLHAEKLKQCAFAVCISDYGRSKLVANVSAGDAGKIVVIRCGHALPEQSAIPPPPRQNHIVCVARLSPEKGHGILIEALASLRDKGVPFICTLVGAGPLEAELRSRIASLGLSDRIRMVGAKPPDEVMGFVRQADLCVLASYGEGIPIALLEAFGYRRPVVATSVGGIPELVHHNENGLLVEPGDPQALADSIQLILNDRERAETMGHNGFETVAHAHDPSQSAILLRDCFLRAHELTAAVAELPILPV